MWHLAPWAGVVAVATAVQLFWVPRLATPALDADDAPPDFTRLRGAPHVAAAAVLALAAGSVFATVAPPHWGLWFFYLALGAPLVLVDAHTTYLPNELMHPLLSGCAGGVVVLLVHHPPAAIGALVGAAAGYGAFWCVWRFSSTFGFGDVRLAAAVGAVAGASGPNAWVLAFVVGTGLGAVAAVVAHLRRRAILPYGPWLWAGPVVAVWLPGG